MSMTRRNLVVNVLAFAALTTGCTEIDAIEEPGTLVITISTAGNQSDIDPNGYAVRVNSGLPRRSAANSRAFLLVEPGTHVVDLSDLAPNCSAADVSESVEVTRGSTSEVVFVVVCAPNVGTVEITTTTTGTDLDADGYTVQLPGVTPTTLVANGAKTFSNVRVGTFPVTLGGVSRNCAVDGPAQVANITYGGTVKLSFTVRCVISGTLQITAVTTGDDIDADGYIVALRIDNSGGTVHVAVPSNGTANVSGMLPGTYGVTLSGLSPNCAIGGALANVIVVPAGTETRLALTIRCAVVKHIVFVHGSGTATEIHLINSNGTGSKQLTSSAGRDEDPAWSPDGSRIVFTSERDGNREIYIMNADGGNVTRVTNQAGPDSRPAWSPDGNRIAFQTERDGNSEIYVMNIDGSGLTRLTNNTSVDAEPAWSPDGTRIAFRSQRDGNGAIWVMNANGTGAQIVAPNPANDAQPTWSPDGTLIAFSRSTSSTTRDIFTVSVSGSSIVTKITSGLVSGNDPSWSPDGRQLAIGAVTQSCYSFYYYYYVCDPLIMVIGVNGESFSFPPIAPASDPAWRP